MSWIFSDPKLPARGSIIDGLLKKAPRSGIGGADGWFDNLDVERTISRGAATVIQARDHECRTDVRRSRQGALSGPRRMRLQPAIPLPVGTAFRGVATSPGACRPVGTEGAARRPDKHARAFRRWWRLVPWQPPWPGHWIASWYGPRQRTSPPRATAGWFIAMDAAAPGQGRSPAA